MASVPDSLLHRGQLPIQSAPSDSSCSSIAWATAYRLWDSLKNAWFWFDKHAGYWLGLDTPKYAWAISEHNRLLKEGEESVFTSEFKKKEIQMDKLEGQPSVGGPSREDSAITAPTIADVDPQSIRPLVSGEGSSSSAPVDAHEKYSYFKA